MSGFTPGPWELDEPDRNDQLQITALDRLIAVVCHECTESGERQMQANALLIAAAPTMVAALQDALPAITQARVSIEKCVTDEVLRRAMDEILTAQQINIQAALAKARGDGA